MKDKLLTRIILSYCKIVLQEVLLINRISSIKNSYKSNGVNMEFKQFEAFVKVVL